MNSAWHRAGLGMISFWGLTLVGMTAAGGAEAEPDELGEFVASLAGGWAGENNSTPVGVMPFALLFEWEEDGSLHAHSALNRETYVDLRFQCDDEGRWSLTEEAAMEGLGTQSHTLLPEKSGKLHEGLRRWIHPEDPEYLTVDVGVVDGAMKMNVTLRGEDHARFDLARIPDGDVPELARQLRASANQSPDEGTSIEEFVTKGQEGYAEAAEGNPSSEAPLPGSAAFVEQAREALAGRPDDARAHLDLAKALGAAIQSDPNANGPRYAFEMLTTLQRSIELDPRLGEAYHHLVGYYLNAPPIAGGSIEKAEDLARQLAEFDPEGGKLLLAQIQARRSVGD